MESGIQDSLGLPYMGRPVNSLSTIIENGLLFGSLRKYLSIMAALIEVSVVLS